MKFVLSRGDELISFYEDNQSLKIQGTFNNPLLIGRDINGKTEFPLQEYKLNSCNGDWVPPMIRDLSPELIDAVKDYNGLYEKSDEELLDLIDVCFNTYKVWYLQ